MAFTGNDVRIKGDTLKFAALNGAPEIDLSKLNFYFSQSRPEDAFMKGNIYGGQFKSGGSAVGPTWYLFLIRATARDGYTFFVGQGFGKRSNLSKIVCDGKKQKCVSDSGSKNTFAFSKDKEGNLMVISSNGWSSALTKIGTLPPKVIEGTK